MSRTVIAVAIMAALTMDVLLPPRPAGAQSLAVDAHSVARSPDTSHVAVILVHGIMSGKANWDTVVGLSETDASASPHAFPCSLLMDDKTRNGAVIYRFTYDWRQPVAYTAACLGQAIEDMVLSAHADAKVVLVGHSYGGLIARYYIERAGGDRHLARLITIATPHHGTPYADANYVSRRSQPVGPLVRWFWPYEAMRNLAWDDLVKSIVDVRDINYDLQALNRDLERRPDLLSKYVALAGNLTKSPRFEGAAAVSDLMDATVQDALDSLERVLRPIGDNDGVVTVESALLRGVRGPAVRGGEILGYDHVMLLHSQYTNVAIVHYIKQALDDAISLYATTTAGGPVGGTGAGSAVTTFVSESSVAAAAGAPGFYRRGAVGHWQETFRYGDGGHMLWKYTNGSTENGSADWRPNLPEPGWYEVQAFIPRWFASTRQAHYTVQHGDGQTLVNVNQADYYDQWVSLGTYRFDRGSLGAVRLSDVSTEGYGAKWIGFDAVRWERRDPPHASHPGDPIAPTDLRPRGNAVVSSAPTMTWQDTGTASGQPCRLFDVMLFRLTPTESILQAESGWITEHAWRVQVPDPGCYQWLVFSNNGVDPQYATSSWEWFQVGPPAPSPPWGAWVFARSATTVAIGWMPNSKNHDGFAIERRSGTAAFQRIAMVGPDATTFEDSGLTSNTSYTYRVGAHNAGGSSYAPEQTVITLPRLPEAASDLSATVVGGTLLRPGRVELSWRNNASDATATYVRRASGDKLHQWQVDAGVTSFVDDTVAPNTLYTYSVHVYNGQLFSESSNAVTVANVPFMTPAHDNLADAARVPDAMPGLYRQWRCQWEADTRGATKEPDEPSHAGNRGGASLWYKWLAPYDGRVAVTVSPAAFRPLVAVYSTSLAGHLVPVAASAVQDKDGNTLVVFEARSSTAYDIAIDGYDGASGRFYCFLLQSPPPPANDDFANADPIAGAAGVVAGRTLSATAQLGEPADGDDAGASIWYKWTAPATGTYTFSTYGSDFWTTLEVYEGDDVSHLAPVARNVFNDNGMTPTSKLRFAAIMGRTYRIAVDGQRLLGPETGESVLKWMPTPSNDDAQDATDLAGPSGSVLCTNQGATSNRGSGEPGWGGGASVWFRWTAPISGSVRFTTHGSAINTLLWVFATHSAGDLSQVAFNADTSADDNTSQLGFAATAGTTYLVKVDGDFDGANSNWEGATGTVVLSWAYPALLSAAVITSSADRAITLAWSSSAATSYSVRRSTSSAGAPIEVGRTTMLRYCDADIANDVSYFYSVVPCLRNIEGTGSAITGASAAQRPPPPTGLVARATSPTTVDLAWTYSGPDCTGFRVYRTIGTSGGMLADSVGAEVRAFVDSGLPPGTLTTYQVCASNSSGDSGRSGSASVRTTKASLEVLSVSPQSARGGTAIGGTVCLNGPAPPGGVMILLRSSNAAATTPASVRVPFGEVARSFVIRTRAVRTKVAAKITAVAQSVVRTVTVTLTP